LAGSLPLNRTIAHTDEALAMWSVERVVIKFLEAPRREFPSFAGGFPHSFAPPLPNERRACIALIGRTFAPDRYVY
jgi:hypothetical protein